MRHTGEYELGSRGRAAGYGRGMENSESSEREPDSDETEPVAPPGSGKNDPEAAQRAEDEVDRLRGGPEERAVDHARDELSRLRKKE
jgi:hypothetical protein